MNIIFILTPRYILKHTNLKMDKKIKIKYLSHFFNEEIIPLLQIIFNIFNL